ncbi:MAG: C40 family peptidase [Flavobacteriales bacterium]|nr:C40 family peptidase [Flavobacteriales bacterium]
MNHTFKILLLLFFSAVAINSRAQVKIDTLEVKMAVLKTPYGIEDARIIDSIIIYDETHYSVVEDTVEKIISPIIEKYAQIIGVEPSMLENEKIYEFIDQWIGTPYRYGGTSKKGIDCSGLTRELYTNVQNLLLPRSSREMFSSDMVERLTSEKKDISLLHEGDLVFFRRKGYIYHVGVYLCDGKFLSANRSGVEISDINSVYWKKYYYAAARIMDVYLDNKTANN